MPAFRILIACMLALAVGRSAYAQEEPEAVYERMHSAALAGKADEVFSHGTAAAQAEIAKLPQEQKEATLRFLSQSMPKTYTVTEKAIAPDGNSATLRAAGSGEFQGQRGEAYLQASFLKENGAWKVARWAWSNQKPPAAPAKPAVATPATPEPVQESKIVRRGPATDPTAATPAQPQSADTARAVPRPAGLRRPSRAHLDARACLKLPTNGAIRACAEKFR